MTCKTCDRYEQMGFGQQCPCTHINGKCQSETLTSQLPDVTRFLTNRRNMNRTIYAIRDRIAQDLAGMFPLVVFRTDAQAVRYFGDSMATEGSQLAKHASDFELIKVGQIEDDGQITNYPPEIIITGDALIAATQPNETLPMRFADSQEDAHAMVQKRHIKEA